MIISCCLYSFNINNNKLKYFQREKLWEYIGTEIDNVQGARRGEKEGRKEGRERGKEGGGRRGEKEGGRGERGGRRIEKFSQYGFLIVTMIQ